MAQTDQMSELKSKLKTWEYCFKQCHMRKPEKADIDTAPDEIRDAYREYGKLRRGLTVTPAKENLALLCKDNNSIESNVENVWGVAADRVMLKKSYVKLQYDDDGSVNDVDLKESDNTTTENWSTKLSQKLMSSSIHTLPLKNHAKKANSRIFSNPSSSTIHADGTDTSNETNKNLDFFTFKNTPRRGMMTKRKSVPLGWKEFTVADCDKESAHEDVVDRDQTRVPPVRPHVVSLNNGNMKSPEDEHENYTNDQSVSQKAWKPLVKTDYPGYRDIFAPQESCTDKLVSCSKSSQSSYALSYQGDIGHAVEAQKTFKDLPSVAEPIDTPVSSPAIAVFKKKHSFSTMKDDPGVKATQGVKNCDDTADISRPTCKTSTKSVARHRVKKMGTRAALVTSNSVQSVEQCAPAADPYVFEATDTEHSASTTKFRTARKPRTTVSKSKKRKTNIVESDDENRSTEESSKPAAKKQKAAVSSSSNTQVRAPARAPKMSTRSLNENFVKINLKKKRFARGKAGLKGAAYKRQQWKDKMSAKRGTACFKCGEEGHWANKCPNKGACKKEKETVAEEFDEEADGFLADMPVELYLDDMMESTYSTEEQGFSRPALPPAPPYFKESDSKEACDKRLYTALKVFGYDSFRTGQEETVNRILKGRSTLVMLSTGAGKSLCYQLPAYMIGEERGALTIVICPLVSLMEDQVTDLPAGVNGVCLHTNQTDVQRKKIMDDILAGNVHFLLVSPEFLCSSNQTNLEFFNKMPPVSFACIDEAHCLSEWSHNFRPSYLRVCKILHTKFNVHCFLGLTATATMETVETIGNHLCLKDSVEDTVKGTILPPNLNLSASKDNMKEQALLNLLKGPRFVDSDSIIIYCTRREQTDRLATLIRTVHGKEEVKPGRGRYARWDAHSYHAGMSAACRKRIQKAFMTGRLRIVVATVAFGMGLDKSDVRAVIHYTLPKGFESYVQEIGRAGRDGLPAECHVFLENEVPMFYCRMNTNFGLFMKLYYGPIIDLVDQDESDGRLGVYVQATFPSIAYFQTILLSPIVLKIAMGSDMAELEKHTYANTVDPISLRKLLSMIYIPCKCTMLAETIGTDPAFACHGHERALTIDSTVNDLDITEEGLVTLLYYIELHNGKWLENLTPVYSVCTIRCYSGPAALHAAAKKCPPLGVAMALAKKNGKTTSNRELVFPVMDVVNILNKSSGYIKRELKQLQWLCTKDGQYKRSGISVEFSSLAMKVKVPGNLSEEQQDEVLSFLQARVKSQELKELTQLHTFYSALDRVAYKDYWVVEDKADLKRSETLKTSVTKYFHADVQTVDRTDPLMKVTTPDQEVFIRSTVNSFICTYSHEHDLTGRSIAKVLFGISSPCFPSQVWGKVRRFWRCLLRQDFNTVCRIGTEELLRLK